MRCRFRSAISSCRGARRSRGRCFGQLRNSSARKEGHHEEQDSARYGRLIRHRPSDGGAARDGFSVAPVGAEESSIEQVRSIFDTNFFGIVRMTRAVVPHMRQQGGGCIINMGSVLGFLPMSYRALYAATKHAIEGYSESLDHELRTRGIRVSIIEPAYMKTQFDANCLVS
jgi:NAD(P)-dependent dehydrogenase (short-subunit alcohol dehydrogenase family)